MVVAQLAQLDFTFRKESVFSMVEMAKFVMKTLNARAASAVKIAVVLMELPRCVNVAILEGIALFASHRTFFLALGCALSSVSVAIIALLLPNVSATVAKQVFAVNKFFLSVLHVTTLDSVPSATLRATTSRHLFVILLFPTDLDVWKIACVYILFAKPSIVAILK